MLKINLLLLLGGNKYQVFRSCIHYHVSFLSKTFQTYKMCVIDTMCHITPVYLHNINMTHIFNITYQHLSNILPHTEYIEFWCLSLSRAFFQCLQCVRCVVDFSQAQKIYKTSNITTRLMVAMETGAEHDCERRWRLLSWDENFEGYIASGRKKTISNLILKSFYHWCLMIF